MGTAIGTAMPIECHEECINNQVKYYKCKVEELDQLNKEIKKLKEDIEIYALQIIKAKQFKKLSFDRDRFKI